MTKLAVNLKMEGQKGIAQILAVGLLAAAMIAGTIMVQRVQETRRGAAYAGGEVLMLPGTKTIKPGERMLVTLAIDAKTHKLSGVDLKVKYDPTLFKLVGLKPLVAGVETAQSGVRYMFKSAEDVLKNVVDNGSGEIRLSGVSMEMDPTKMPTGIIWLAKVEIYGLKEGAGEFSLDTTGSMLTGYNPEGTDQVISIDKVQTAKYTVAGASSDEMICRRLWWFDDNNPTCGQREFCGAYAYLGLKTFESEEACRGELVNVGILDPRVTPGSGQLEPKVAECGWCGTNCTRLNPEMACIMIAPPEGKSCVEEAGSCVIKIDGVVVQPTRGMTTPVPRLTGVSTIKSCNMRCFSNSTCGAGAVCYPIWIPRDCEITDTALMSRLQANSALTTTEKQKLIGMCPGLATYFSGETNRAPSFVGVCRNAVCPAATGCACSGSSIPMSTPIVREDLNRPGIW